MNLIEEMKKIILKIKPVQTKMPQSKPDFCSYAEVQKVDRQNKEKARQERKEKIMKRLQEHYQELKNRGYDVAALFLQGSQNYELDEYSEYYQSDIDSKAIIVPSIEDFVAGKAPISTTIILENNEHIDVKDIRVIFPIMKKMNLSYLELLYTNFYIINPEYEEEILALRRHRAAIAASNRIQLIKAMYGMAMEKKKALCHPYPGIKDKIDKYGYDGKQLSHAVRIRMILENFIMKDELVFVQNEKDRHRLMCLKKQSKENGNFLDRDAAIEMMEKEIKDIKFLVDMEMLEKENYPIKTEPLEIMDRVQRNILMKKIKRESEEINIWHF